MVNSFLSPQKMKEQREHREYFHNASGSFQLDVHKKGPKKDHFFKRRCDDEDGLSYGKLRKTEPDIQFGPRSSLDSHIHSVACGNFGQNMQLQFIPVSSAEESRDRILHLEGVISPPVTSTPASSTELGYETSQQDHNHLLESGNLESSPLGPTNLAGLPEKQESAIINKPMKNKPFKIVKKKNLMKKHRYNVAIMFLFWSVGLFALYV